jgi:hypothetical protein
MDLLLTFIVQLLSACLGITFGYVVFEVLPNICFKKKVEHKGQEIPKECCSIMYVNKLKKQ